MLLLAPGLGSATLIILASFKKILYSLKKHLRVNCSNRNVSIPKQSANLNANNPHSITTHHADNLIAIFCLCVFSGDRGRGRRLRRFLQQIQ